MKQYPPIEDVEAALRLDVDTGNLYWIRRKRGRVLGSRAGFLNKETGYRQVGIGVVTFQEHRVVFALANGCWPSLCIDHINGIRDDNRPCNLREATHSQNQHNRGVRKDSVTGVKGVTWSHAAGGYVAEIRLNWVKHCLGTFPTVDLAANAYAAAAARLHGEFRRLA